MLNEVKLLFTFRCLACARHDKGMMCTCHWRVLLLRHPRYARPMAAILADNKTAWERHWRVLLLRHPHYARPVAAKLADNKTTFCHSRTYVRDLIFRDILRFFRASPQQNVSSLCSIEMTRLLRHPRYARPVAAILADNKTAWERHWRVLLLRHPRYARLMAAILADNKTAFCRSRTLCEESPYIQMSRMRST